MPHQNRISGAAGLIAAASLAFSPAQAQAADLGAQSASDFTTSYLLETTGANTARGPLGPLATPGSDMVQEHHRYRRYRGYRGYRGHRRGIRGRDIFAGALIIGGIAAIASAANKNRRRDREVVVVERERTRDYDYRPENRRNTSRSTSGGSGIDNAVSMCLNEIEQDIRVDSVDGASRVGSGWIVTGSLFDGSGFSCQIDNSGRISGIDYGRGGQASSSDGAQPFESGEQRAEGQLSDDLYSRARADVGGGTRPDLAVDAANAGAETRPLELAINTEDERLPAYPGGPLPGEEVRD